MARSPGAAARPCWPTRPSHIRGEMMSGYSPAWSNDELEDLLRDGWPTRAVAARVGRSTFAVIRMALKIGIPIRRAPTTPMQIQFDSELHKKLRELAAQRNVTRTRSAG